MMRFGLVCWRHLLGSLLVLGLVLGVGIEDVKADLSWTCTKYMEHYQDGGGYYWAVKKDVPTNNHSSGYNPAYTLGLHCHTATITGSISASITEADRNAIINGVIGSTIMTSIKNNTEYTKDGNTWSAARWAAEGYTLSSSILTDTTAIKTKVNTISTDTTNIKTQIQDIKVAVESNPPFIHNIKGKNNATATSNGKFTVIIEAQNATEYRARYDNSAWIGWISSKEIEITGIPKGVKIITVEAKNNKDETYSKEMTVFSL